MCEPTTIAAVALIAGGALKAKGEMDQANADADTLAFQRDMERVKAVDASQRGAQQEGIARTKGTQEVSSQATQIAQGGLETSGTAAKVLSDTRAMSELDALTIRSNAAREAWGHQMQAEQYDRAAKAKRDQAATAGLGTFLGSAAKLGSLAG